MRLANPRRKRTLTAPFFCIHTIYSCIFLYTNAYCGPEHSHDQSMHRRIEQGVQSESRPKHKFRVSFCRTVLQRSEVDRPNEADQAEAADARAPSKPSCKNRSTYFVYRNREGFERHPSGLERPIRAPTGLNKLKQPFRKPARCQSCLERPFRVLWRSRAG